MTRKYFRFFIIIFVCVCVAQSTWSATVHLKNGQTIEGIVRDSGGSTVTVVTPGGTFNYPREAILRIEQSSNYSDTLVQARSLENSGNFADAILLYAEAIKQANDPSEKQQITEQQRGAIQKFVNRVEDRDPLEQGLQTVDEIENLKKYISDPGNLALLQSARKAMDQRVVNQNYNHAQTQEKRRNYEEAIKSFNVIKNNYPDHPLARNLERRLAQLNVEWGIEEFKKAELPTQEIRDIFNAALAHDPDNDMANFYLGRMAYLNKLYDRAASFLNQVDTSALPSRETAQFSTMMRQIERMSQPATQPTPRPVATPEPEPTPVPGMMERVKGFFNNAWGNTKEFASGLMSGTGSSMNQLIDALVMVGYGIGALILLWYIPLRILHKDLPKRSVVYNDWRTIIKYTGALGLIAYFIDRWRREEPSKRCPACNRKIDDPEVFENYDFSVCPYCEKKIKPPFTIPDIIKSRANTLLVSKALANGVQDETAREHMIGIVNLIMIYGRKIRASDIHIEPEQGNLLIRYRVDGVMTESIALDMQLNMALVSSIKVVCNLNIAERRLPQDGHFRRVLMGDEVNVRVSTIPTRGGEKVVMRLLDQKIATATLDSLGMRDEALEAYRQAVRAPHGLILATGPTGSGKTTLQYASLQFINDGSKNITTVEDPIEYELEGINQVQHNTATGLTFATALRSILRQDPDVIMVGEVRDLETATIAVNAALTGHLVFSTLHTIDTSTALSRLIDIGVDVKMLSSAIINIVAQRLVRKLCPHCKKQTSISAKEIKLLGPEGKKLEGQTIYKGKGCSECGGTGFIGRLGIYEMLVPNRELRQLVEKGGSATEIRQVSRQGGMKTLREEGLMKVSQGLTSIDEVIRVTSEDFYEEDPLKPEAEAAGQPQQP